MKTKFKIKIKYYDGYEDDFIKESICSNFFVAIEEDLLEIGNLIYSDECIEYDFEII